MGSQQDVYVINAEDILDKYPGEGGAQPGPRGLAPASQEEGRTASRGRRGARLLGSPRAFVASTLSLFVCGAGQAYNGQWKLGLLLFLTEVFAVAAHWSAVRLWPALKSLAYIFAIGELEMFLFLAVADFLLVFFLLYNVAQAYQQAEMEGYAFNGFRQPILAGLASLVVPGWGQLLNAQLGKALFFLFCLLAEIYLGTLLLLSPLSRFAAQLNLDGLLSRRAPFLILGIGFTGALFWILSVYDAFLVARYRGRA